MQPFAKACLALLALAAVQGACRGTLPPTEPPRSGDATPGTRTNDTPVAAPIAGDSIPSDPMTASGGTNALPLPGPSGGTSTGGSAALP
jgi:hypothetical protein